MADHWRGLGLARMLLERLVDHAACSGIRCMSGGSIAGNEPMIAFAESAGFAVMRKREDGRLVHLVKDLPAPVRLTSRSPQPPSELAAAA